MSGYGSVVLLRQRHAAGRRFLRFLDPAREALQGLHACGTIEEGPCQGEKVSLTIHHRLVNVLWEEFCV